MVNITALFFKKEALTDKNIPAFTLSPTCNADILTVLPLSRVTLAADGKQTGGVGGGAVVVVTPNYAGTSKHH